jgi:hypothetical protein
VRNSVAFPGEGELPESAAAAQRLPAGRRNDQDVGARPQERRRRVDPHGVVLLPRVEPARQAAAHHVATLADAQHAVSGGRLAAAAGGWSESDALGFSPTVRHERAACGRLYNFSQPRERARESAPSDVRVRVLSVIEWAGEKRHGVHVHVHVMIYTRGMVYTVEVCEHQRQCACQVSVASESERDACAVRLCLHTFYPSTQQDS